MNTTQTASIMLAHRTRAIISIEETHPDLDGARVLALLRKAIRNCIWCMGEGVSIVGLDCSRCYPLRRVLMDAAK